MKKVVKFGGSSLASAEQFKKVGNIIRKEESRRYVIPSAPGKRTPDDTKVTDMLYSCYGQAILGEDAERDFEEQLEAIKERYNSIISGLDLELSLDEEFKTEYPEKVAAIRSEEYYVNMMRAWYFATALAKQYEKILPFIEEQKLDVWTHNKTIQKAIESYRITPEQKEYLRGLKIKK